jgi:FkbM family methyltransferase
MIYFRNPYRAAVGQACLRKMPLVRHGLNRITMEAKRVSSRIRTVLARVKRKLLKKPFLKDRRFPPYWINKQLGNKAAYLVQIGSNDGKTGDPFFPLLRMNKHWKALFVEPIPFFFEKLKQNYPDTERFRFENAGVNEGRTMEFYWLKPEIYEQFDDLPYWYEQLGSFDRGHIISQVKKDVLPFITSAPVAGIRLDDLLQRHQVQEIDILHIDAEGYDWKILAQLDLQRYRPDFILFEYHHLSPEEQAGAADFLKEYYELFQVGIDAFAVRRDIGAAFLQAMAKALSKKK